MYLNLNYRCSYWLQNGMSSQELCGNNLFISVPKFGTKGCFKQAFCIIANSWSWFLRFVRSRSEVKLWASRVDRFENLPSKMLLPPNFGVTPEGQEVSEFHRSSIFWAPFHTRSFSYQKREWEIWFHTNLKPCGIIVNWHGHILHIFCHTWSMQKP